MLSPWVLMDTQGRLLVNKLSISRAGGADRREGGGVKLPGPGCVHASRGWGRLVCNTVCLAQCKVRPPQAALAVAGTWQRGCAGMELTYGWCVQSVPSVYASICRQGAMHACSALSRVQASTRMHWDSICCDCCVVKGEGGSLGARRA